VSRPSARIDVTEESIVIRTKSAYEPASPQDGYRVFIEPVWPRDLPKGKALGADWRRELYPSQSLREWMRLNPRKAELFRDRYLLELAHNEKAVEKIRTLHAGRGTLTILTVPVEGPWDIYETLAGYLRVMCE